MKPPGSVLLAALGLVAFTAHATPVAESPNREIISTEFTKGAAQFCIPNLSAEDQSRYYSRIANIGASYAHGCTDCEVNPKMRAALLATGDDGWMRRNLPLRFLEIASWKNPAEFSHDFVSIVENDPVSNFASMFPQKELRQRPYTSRWLYDPHSDRYAVLTAADWQHLQALGGFSDEAEIVGGAPIRNNRKFPVPTGNLKGQIFQTIPGRYAAQGATSKMVIDFGADGAPSNVHFRNLGDAGLHDYLYKNKWNDNTKREQLVSKTAENILSARPTVLYAVDAVAWDAIQLTAYLIGQKKPANLLVRLLTVPPIAGRLYPAWQGNAIEDRMHADFFEVLARVSRGNEQTGPVPVFLARLIDNPMRTALRLGLQEEFGTLLGSYIKATLGIDIGAEITAALKRIDPDTLRFRDRPGFFWQLEAEAGVPLFAPLRVPPPFDRIVADFLNELPLALASADQAFAYMNKSIREFTARTDNNVHLVNADVFYRNFTKVVHPFTLHPSLAGAHQIAPLFQNAVCETNE